MRIAPSAWLYAWVGQRLIPLVVRVPKVELTSRSVAAPEVVEVPTRHGPVRCFLYRPHPDAPLAGRDGRRPPLHLQIHGGAFIVRNVREDHGIANYVACEVGAFVLNIDYHAAPQVRYPVAQEECYDVLLWAVENVRERGWDAERISLCGGSAGATLATNVLQLSYWHGGPRARAAALTFAAVDVTRADRTSTLPKPLVSPKLQRLILDTYYVDAARRTEPLASPQLDPDLAAAMPPLLIMTAELDTLAPEMDRLADRLSEEGVPVVHRRFAGADHGLANIREAAVIRESIYMIGNHLLRNL